MFVIATAGHVDHGKSTLVRALTGINPDRLREEQQREMTIDLGFAWMNLPQLAVSHQPSAISQTQIGIVDVPGHIDFIENMLAGVGGVDAALLVIAADEGPMPQTLEHLSILQLLQVQRAVVALTKADLVDEDWIALISEDVRKLLAPTPLAHAPIVPVSVRAGTGLPNLVQTLANVLSDAPPRRNISKPRLPVDRVFSVQGFGTVVTGTLADGLLAIGDEVEILTQRGESLPSRVRGLQTHKQKLEQAAPGSRVAINLTNVDVAQALRGSVVAKPGVLKPTTLIDVRVELLGNSLGAGLRPAPTHAGFVLRHNTEVKIFNGAAQSMAMLWLLEGDELKPGQSAWAQLQLASHMAVTNGDRFILRLPSPSVTVGGGVVVDAHPAMRYRRKAGRADAAVRQRLEALSKGTPAERLANALRELKFTSREEAVTKAQLNSEEFEQAASDLNTANTMLVSQGVLGLTDGWRSLLTSACELLAAFHAAQPLQEGMPRDTLRSRLKLEAKVFNALLAIGYSQSPIANSQLTDDGETVRLPTHRVQLNPTQQKAVYALLAQCAAQPWNTPLVKDCKTAVSDIVYDVLLRQRKLVQCGPEVALLAETYDAAVQRVRDIILREGQITAAQARDAFGTTRKYALGLLEHLDAIGVTKRVGDARVLR